MKKEAYLYERLVGKKVVCLTCQRKCIILEGKKGWCRTGINEDGILYSLIYGEVSSLSINPIEKKPVFHFYPGLGGFLFEALVVTLDARDARTGR